MRNRINIKTDELKDVLYSIEASNIDGKKYETNEALEESIKIIMSLYNCGGKIILVGNGASASIASHIAVDFWKNAGIQAITFNDSPALTCISNDYGYEHVFEKPIEKFAEAGDLLIAISSSGSSENILRAVKAARSRCAGVITLSGFSRDNPLREKGDINLYVPSDKYGYVEIVHHFICHCMVDVTSEINSG